MEGGLELIRRVLCCYNFECTRVCVRTLTHSTSSQTSKLVIVATNLSGFNTSSNMEGVLMLTADSKQRDTSVFPHL